ncbi:site-2 protease family protein [Patescibacteria group bacterium]|nr:site-2 protease family protein [Patescibacteria group bacterium]
MFIFLAIVGLSIVVFFHELGHFILAKIFKIRVEEFGFGYPPRVCGFVRSSDKKFRFKFFWSKNEPLEAKTRTIYSLNWIPFGGFNKLKGELGEKSNNDPDSFFVQVWWKKVLVAAGGILMNIFLAFFIFALCYFVGLPQDVEQISGGKILRPVGIQIGMVMPDSPADQAGLKIGDIILGLDSQEFKQVKEIQAYIETKLNQSLEIKVKRQEEIINRVVNVIPGEQIFDDMKESRGVIGIALSQTVIVAYPWHQSIFLGIKTTISLTGRLFHGLWLILKNLVVHQQMIGQLLGPVGITTMAGDMARVGFIYLLQFIGLLSVAIGVFQIIPFPALDGSRIVFSIIEGARRKPINSKIELISINIGFYILLLLLLFITVREIFSLF